MCSLEPWACGEVKCPPTMSLVSKESSYLVVKASGQNVLKNKISMSHVLWTEIGGLAKLKFNILLSFCNSVRILIRAINSISIGKGLLI